MTICLKQVLLRNPCSLLSLDRRTSHPTDESEPPAIATELTDIQSTGVAKSWFRTNRWGFAKRTFLCSLGSLRLLWAPRISGVILMVKVKHHQLLTPNGLNDPEIVLPPRTLGLLVNASEQEPWITIAFEKIPMICEWAMIKMDIRVLFSTRSFFCFAPSTLLLFSLAWILLIKEVQNICAINAYVHISATSFPIRMSRVINKSEVQNDDLDFMTKISRIVCSVDRWNTSEPLSRPKLQGCFGMVFIKLSRK